MVAIIGELARVVVHTDPKTGAVGVAASRAMVHGSLRPRRKRRRRCRRHLSSATGAAAERRHVSIRNYALRRRHTASAAAPTNSSNTVPGSGTAAGPPETGTPAGTDTCTAGLEACSVALLSMLLTAGAAANETDSLASGDAASNSAAPVMLPNTTWPFRPITSMPEVGNAWELVTVQRAAVDGGAAAIAVAAGEHQRAAAAEVQRRARSDLASQVR